MGFEVHFADEHTTTVTGADAYEQEGPLTTFFARNGGAGRLASAFSVRVASFRTDRLVEIRRLADVAEVPDLIVGDDPVVDPPFEAAS
jgi:hypothetical protein